NGKREMGNGKRETGQWGRALTGFTFPVSRFRFPILPKPDRLLRRGDRGEGRRSYRLQRRCDRARKPALPSIARIEKKRRGRPRTICRENFTANNRPGNAVIAVV